TLITQSLVHNKRPHISVMLRIFNLFIHGRGDRDNMDMSLLGVAHILFVLPIAQSIIRRTSITELDKICFQIINPLLFAEQHNGGPWRAEAEAMQESCFCLRRNFIIFVYIFVYMH
ncbi:hypothetical protein ACJX0J_027971, partial [Zea mays]